MGNPAGSVKIRRLDQKSDIDQFIRFAWKVYEGNPCWVPPIIRDTRNFLGGKTLFFRHCDHALWAAEEGPEVVATLAAFYDRNFSEHWGTKTGFLGHFEALEGKQDAVRELICAGESFLRSQGAEEVWAPVSGGIANPVGFLSNAFDQPPYFLMAYTPSYYPVYFRRTGYSPAQELIAYTMDLMDGRLRRKVNFILKRAERSEVRLRPFDRKRFREESDHFAEIYAATFKQHWGYTPQSQEEVFELLEPMRLAIDSDLILFAERQGETVGFTLTVPDYNEAIKKLDGDLELLKGLAFLRMKKGIRRARLIAIGVLPQFRGMNIAPLLVAGAFDAMIRKGYTTCEYSWVLKENVSSSHVAEKFHSQAYKRYEIYAKKLV